MKSSHLGRRFVALLVAASATILLIEIGAAALVETGAIDTPRPSFGDTGVWRGDHPEFGVWHRPDTREEHQRSCFRVRVRTNSVGARDVERPLASEQPRVVVLGDSFLEGWGVPESDRLSNLLEASTGVPHLNFAMAHFSPYQEYLVYSELASRFDHGAVIASVLPANDFADLDLALARTMEDYDYRYRPYLVGEAPRFERMDYREPRVTRLLRRYSYGWNAVQSVKRARTSQPEAPGPASDTPHSWFYDFDERQFAILAASLERLAAAADGRPVALLLIPVLRDLTRLARDGPAPLSRRLAEVAARLGFQLVDLLPLMAEHTRAWPAYFLPCDYHWSIYGNRVAEQIVRESLASTLYAKSPPEPPPADGAGVIR